MQVFRKLLFPFSLLYGAIVFVRNKLYDTGVLSSQSFNTPTICVGNLSVGGTGKTPMIEKLVRTLQGEYSLAILSRGYKRKSKGYVLAQQSTAVEIIGDEPYQLKQKFTDVRLAVDANRSNGIHRLEKTVMPDIILLDDAYQHRKVKPSYSILLTSYGNLYCNDRYLPTGNLRDSKSAAVRANMIVVTKCPDDLSVRQQQLIYDQIDPGQHQTMLFANLEYDDNLHGRSQTSTIEALKSEPVTLVTGIANPLPMVNYLKGRGLKFEHLEFADHHFFTEKELALLKTKTCVLTTEKDFVRLNKHIQQLYYLPIRHNFLNDGEVVFKRKLKEFMQGNS